MGGGSGVVSGGGQWQCGGQTPLPARGAAVAKCREETDPAPAAGGGGGASESAWERGGPSREGERAERDAGEARGSERPPGSRSPAALRPRPCPRPCGRPVPLRPPPPGLRRMEDSRETSPSSNNSSEELSSALQLSKGMSIFLDVSPGRRSWVVGPPASFLFPGRRAVGPGTAQQLVSCFVPRTPARTTTYLAPPNPCKCTEQMREE